MHLIENLTGFLRDPEKQSFLLLILGLTFLVIYLALERKRLLFYRQKIPIRIHINGTRGKSSTTRLIAAILRVNYRTVAKTTGTLPRRILENGSENPILRTGPANISEQIKTLIWAGKRNAEAIVLECMALRPEYQSLCEREIIRASIAVITNIRADHLDVMGPNVEDVGWALAGMIPQNGILITAEQNFYSLLNEACKERNSKLIVIPQEEINKISTHQMAKFSHLEHKENVAIALKISDLLGIPQTLAWKSMHEAPSDPGALVSFPVKSLNSPQSWIFVNALAANDPDSSLGIWNQATSSFTVQNYPVALFNLRDDRADRSLQMADLALECKNAKLIIAMGNGSPLFMDSLRRKNISMDNVINLGDLTADKATHWLKSELPSESIVVAMGNIGGQGFSLVEQLKSQQESLNSKHPSANNNKPIKRELETAAYD